MPKWYALVKVQAWSRMTWCAHTRNITNEYNTPVNATFLGTLWCLCFIECLHAVATCLCLIQRVRLCILVRSVINPYFCSPKQTVQTQIRRRRTRHLIRIYNDSLQEFLFEIDWKWKSSPGTPKIGNWLFQLKMMGGSTRQIWVEAYRFKQKSISYYREPLVSY